MNVPLTTYLRLVANANTMGFIDTESTGLRGDYNSLLVYSALRADDSIKSMVVTTPGADKQLVKYIRDDLESLDLWVSFYGRGHDIPLIQTRLLYHGLRALEPRPHIDMYWGLKFKLNMTRRSQAHYTRWLGTNDQKMDMSPEEWNFVLANPTVGIQRMVKRCESDTRGLRALFHRTKHLIKNANL